MESDFESVVLETEGYSGSDMSGLCREAAMEPLRDPETLEALTRGENVQPRAVSRADFGAALAQVTPSVSEKELVAFEQWNKDFGSFANQASKRQALSALSGATNADRRM